MKRGASVTLCSLARRSPVRILLFILLGLATGSPAARGQVLDLYETRAPTGLNPYTGTGEEWERFTSLIFKSLYEYQDNSQYRAILADSSNAEPSNPDAVGWIVKLRPHTYFYRSITDEYEGKTRLDSVPFTARDVVKSWELFVNGASELRSTWFRDRLERGISSVTAKGDNEVQFMFKAGIRPHRKYLTFPIIPASAIPDSAIAAFPKEGSAQKKFAEMPWGAGAFVFQGLREMRRSGSQYYAFERRQQLGYGAERVRDIRISVKDVVQLGQTLEYGAGTELGGAEDATICVPAVPLKLVGNVDERQYKMQRIFSPTVDEIVFNCQHRFLQDVRVRSALSMALDRRAMLTSLLTSRADTITGPFPADFAFYCDTCETDNYSYLPARADSLLDKAGWMRVEGSDWRRRGDETLELELLSFTGSQQSMAVELAHAVEKAWQARGVKAHVKSVERGQYFDLIQKGEFQAAYYRLRYYVIPNVRRHFGKNGEANISRLDDPEIMAIDREYRSASVPDYVLIFHKWHKRIAEQVPAAFLWAPHNHAAWSYWLNVGQNFYQYNFLGLIENWTIEE